MLKNGKIKANISYDKREDFKRHLKKNYQLYLENLKVEAKINYGSYST